MERYEGWKKEQIARGMATEGTLKLSKLEVGMKLAEALVLRNPQPYQTDF